MKLNEFKLERLFAHLRPKAKYLLSAASSESISMKEVLELADAECLNMWENLKMGYTDYRGHIKLREAITTRYKSLGPDDILEVVPEEGIFILMNAMLDEGDEIIVMHPALPSLYELPKALNCNVIPWKLEANEWGWKLDIDFLARTVTPKTKLIILNSPNNPTGYMPSPTEIQRIANIADRVAAWIFSEETYRGTEHDPANDLPAIADIYQRGISLGGINKLGLAGTRVGWLASPNRTIMDNCLAYKDYTTLCPNAPSEILAIIALRNFYKLMERSHEIIMENLGLAEGYFSSKPQWFEWTPPNGGSTAFPRLREPYKINDLCTKAMDEEQILIVRDRSFGVNENRFRLGFGKADFSHALAGFSDFMERFVKEKINEA